MRCAIPCASKSPLSVRMMTQTTAEPNSTRTLNGFHEIVGVCTPRFARVTDDDVFRIAVHLYNTRCSRFVGHSRNKHRQRITYASQGRSRNSRGRLIRSRFFRQLRAPLASKPRGQSFVLNSKGKVHGARGCKWDPPPSCACFFESIRRIRTQ